MFACSRAISSLRSAMRSSSSLIESSARSWPISHTIRVLGRSSSSTAVIPLLPTKRGKNTPRRRRSHIRDRRVSKRGKACQPRTFAMPALPAQMTAIAIRAPGAPDMLLAQQRPLPRPAEGEVLVKVAAAGVNRPDVMQRQGLYPPPAGATDIPGLEIAGEVVALDAGVTRWKLGDTVMALVVGGGYAEYCAAHETHALPVPAGLTLIAAAAIPETFFTVWHNAFERGRLKAGETLLIHGGSSGIGTAAIQLAKAFGARVIATAGSAEKCDACRRLGADVAVNSKSVDFVAATESGTEG